MKKNLAEFVANNINVIGAIAIAFVVFFLVLLVHMLLYYIFEFSIICETDKLLTALTGGRGICQ